MKLNNARCILAVCPHVDLYDFAFFYVFQYGFIREEDGIRHNFTFFKSISLRYDPFFDFSLLVRIFLFKVFFSIFKNHLITLFLILVLIIIFFDLFNVDKFGEFGEFIFELL